MEERMPDIQYMDMFYFRYYFVPWPDCQKFQELDEEQVYVIPTFIGEQQGCFVNAKWVSNDYSYKDDA